MIKYVVIDVETTIAHKGSPFYDANKLACVGYWTWEGKGDVLDIEYTERPLGDTVSHLQAVINKADMVVAFNAKFDLHWLHRFGVRVHCPVWCLQVYEFVSTAQSAAYPSLDGALRRTGVGVKSVGIEEFWDAGIDTLSIPWEVLKERCLSDVQEEAKLFEWQQADMAKRSPEFQKLIQLEMMDLRALEQIEWNGQLYDKDESIRKADEIDAKVAEIDNKLREFMPEGVAFNWNSVRHKSAILYGGKVEWEEREQVGVYRQGAKAGQPRYRVHHREVELPQLIEPAEGTELADAGYYSTAEPILRGLRTKGPAKRLIDLLLERQSLEKLSGTYYRGIPELIKEMEWKDNIIHGRFNQCVAVTGRLSSSGPNQQNLTDEVKQLMVTRFT
jgi:DNA polymerase I-like protein with 3'-5' exonuclease and polymerase domains